MELIYCCGLMIPAGELCPSCGVDPDLARVEAAAQIEHDQKLAERQAQEDADSRIDAARQRLAAAKDRRAELARSREPREVTAGMVAVCCLAEILAEATGTGLKQFTVRYSGGAISDDRFSYPIVLDLAGLTMAPTLVANMDGQRAAIVGHIPAAGASIDDGTLTLRGV